jgi:hypothetical protein
LDSCTFTEPSSTAAKRLPASGNPLQLVEAARSSACGMFSGRTAGSASRLRSAVVAWSSRVTASSWSALRFPLVRGAAGAFTTGGFGVAFTT